MSGTSLDGIDVVISSFSEAGEFNLIAAHTFPFPETLQLQLQQLIISQRCNLQDFGEKSIALGRLIAQSINQLLASKQLTADDIVAIGSHGQTLFHSPNSEYPFSLQIGDASVIAEITGITTVADFRQRDIAAGGQGAPLVPAFHRAVFNTDDEDRVIVNIGGISNITLLPASTDDVIGFDTGPGNILLDYWTQFHQNEPYDKNGQWAESGQYNEDLLLLLLSEPFFKQTAPKSTGRELFNQTWLEQKLAKFNQDISVTDIQATLVELTAQSISGDIKKYANNSQSIYICGGGAQNDFLMRRLQALLANKNVSTTQVINLHPDWVEACAFAWLAYRTINNQAGNLPAVTGAKHSVILGAIYPA